jgi:hypothetical protein
MRRYVVIGALTLLTLAALYAQQPAPPSTSEILTWISSHLDALSYTSVIGGESVSFSSNYQLAFMGCRISSFTQRSTSVSAKRNDKSTFNYAPFELSNLRPDKIQVHVYSGGQISLEIPFVNSVQSTVQSTVQGDGGTYPNSALMISFATKEMADRQAKAWHDAIIGCGGKAVSDNLY